MVYRYQRYFNGIYQLGMIRIHYTTSRGIAHDGAYGSELLSKDLADELFYQGLLKAGISKSKASVAKWAVEHLAGLHYGHNHDDFNISPYVHLEAL